MIWYNKLIVAAVVGVAIYCDVQLYFIAAEKWLPPELPSDCERLYITFGGMTTQYKPAELSSKDKFKFGIAVSGLKTPFKAYVKRNRLFVDAKAVAPSFTSGQPISYFTVSRGQISSIPADWDKNSSSNAFEIVDSTAKPVFRLIYKKPEHVEIEGIFESEMGPVAFFQGVTMSMDFKPDDAALGRLAYFKYPSWKYPAGIADEKK